MDLGLDRTRTMSNFHLKRVNTAALILATIGTGLMSGLILTYSVAVMPGLGDTGDRTFVDAFQQIDHSLDSATWVWIAIFAGSMLMILLSAGITWRSRMSPSPTLFLVVAAVLYASMMAITGVGIDPRENDIGQAGDPSSGPNLSEARAEFDEDRWMVLNGMRLVTTIGAFGCLAWSLVLSGRSASPTLEEE